MRPLNRRVIAIDVVDGTRTRHRLCVAVGLSIVCESSPRQGRRVQGFHRLRRHSATPFTLPCKATEGKTTRISFVSASGVEGAPLLSDTHHSKMVLFLFIHGLLLEGSHGNDP